MEQKFRTAILETLEIHNEEDKEKIMSEIAEEYRMKLGGKCIIRYNEKQGYVAKMTKEGIIPQFDPEREDPLIILIKVITGYYKLTPINI